MTAITPSSNDVVIGGSSVSIADDINASGSSITVLADGSYVSVSCTKPNKTVYYIGEELDLTGGTISANGRVGYGNNYEYWDLFDKPMNEMKNYIDTSEFNNKKAGTYNIYINYMGGSDSFEVVVLEAPTSSESDFKFDPATGKITAYIGTAKNVIVPSTIGGYNVTGFYDNGYTSNGVFANKDITSLVIPYGVTEIPYNLCYNSSLVSVTIPNSVTKICAKNYVEIGAFANTNLETVDLPDSITYIGQSAFRNTKLKSIKLPKNLKTIDNYAFQNCSNLENVIFNDSLTYIGRLAFAGTNLNQDINISNVKIWEGAFQIKSKNITISNIILTENYSCRDYPHFGYNKNLKYLNINNLTFSNFYSYNNGTSISSGDCAFINCTNLTDVYISNTVFLPKRFFEGCTSLKNINLSSDLKSIYEYCFKNCTSLESITIPSSVTKINDTAFQGCSKDLVINCVYGSEAFNFCLRTGIKYNLISEDDVWDPSMPRVLNVTISKSGNTASTIIEKFDEAIEINNSEYGITDNNTTVLPVKFDFNDTAQYSKLLTGIDTSKIGRPNSGKAEYSIENGEKIYIQFVRFGDASGNGKIDAADFAQTKAIVRGLKQSDTKLNKLSDVSNNGKVDAADFAQIKAKVR